MRIVYSSANYRSSIYRAIVAIIIGAALVKWPHVALNYFIMLLGAMFLSIGLISFITSYRLRSRIDKEMERNGEKRSQTNPYARRMVSLNGIGSMVLGAILLAFPQAFLSLIMFLLALILIIAALGQIVMLRSARQIGYISPASYIFPVVILIAGIVILAKPFETQETMLVIFGITAIFYGVTDLINQYSVNKFRKEGFKHEKEQTSSTFVESSSDDTTVDTDYEEIK